jgi:hypothetical protein
MKPIIIAAQSNSWTIFARSNTMIVSSITTRGIDPCVYFFICVCVVLCVGSGLATGWSPVQGVLCIDYGTVKAAKARKGCRTTEEEQHAL